MYLTKTLTVAGSKRKVCCFGLFIVFVFVFFLITWRSDTWTNTLERVHPSNSCHYMRDRFDFRDANELYFEHQNKNQTNNLIFFLETTCRTTFGAEDKLLKPRQACAIESAALVNPNHEVYVLFASPGPQLNRLKQENLSSEDSVVNRLLDYPNVHFARIYLDTYSSGTPLESWFRDNDALETSKYPTEHTSDVLRLLTLWKFGGTYLDMDVVVVKPLETLGMNWVGREKNSNCANGVINFSRDEEGRKFTDAALREISTNFRGDLWSYNGPALISRVMTELCLDHQMPGNISEDRCLGFRVFDPDYFYPIPYTQWSLYFEPGGMEWIKKTENVTYLYHVWNKLSSQRPTEANSTVPYTYLARKYCPEVYAVTKDYF